MEENSHQKVNTPAFDTNSDYNSDEDSFLENEKVAQETPTLNVSQNSKP